MNKTDRRIARKQLNKIIEELEFTRSQAISRHELRPKIYTSNTLNVVLKRAEKKIKAARLLLEYVKEIEY